MSFIMHATLKTFCFARSSEASFITQADALEHQSCSSFHNRFIEHRKCLYVNQRATRLFHNEAHLRSNWSQVLK